MQKEITEPSNLLDDNGHLLQPGWAKRNIFNYNREKIAKNPFRIKEWDFWEITNQDYKVILNIFDIGLFGVAQFAFTDFNTHEEVSAMIIKLFTRGSVKMPGSIEYKEPLVFSKGPSKMEFDKQGDNIILKIDFPKYQKGKGIKGEFSLYIDPKNDSMVNTIPFKNKKQFVWAQKILCIPATGSINIAGKEYKFSAENESFGVLDWTRAVFPYFNKWKWCAALGKKNGVPFGLNLNYGFGIESSKCMIFYDGKGNHLDEIYYKIDKKNLNNPIIITSNDNRVNLTFEPSFPEKSNLNLLIMQIKGICIYGYFTGEVVLDNGDKILIEKSDKMWGWLEEFQQRW